MKSGWRLFTAVLVGALLAAWHSSAWSCAVCAGNPTDPQSIGMRKAILGLLVVTGGVLSAFASFFVVLWRRSRKVEDPVTEYVDRLEVGFRKEEVTR